MFETEETRQLEEAMQARDRAVALERARSQLIARLDADIASTSVRFDIRAERLALQLAEHLRRNGHTNISAHVRAIVETL